MNDKVYLRLRPSEQAVFASACQIFAAHISRGVVTEENRQTLMEESLRDAILMAKMADDAVASDGEMA